MSKNQNEKDPPIFPLKTILKKETPVTITVQNQPPVNVECECCERRNGTVSFDCGCIGRYCFDCLVKELKSWVCSNSSCKKRVNNIDHSIYYFQINGSIYRPQGSLFGELKYISEKEHQLSELAKLNEAYMECFNSVMKNAVCDIENTLIEDIIVWYLDAYRKHISNVLGCDGFDQELFLNICFLK